MCSTLDEEQALRDAARAMGSFEEIVRSSPEIALIACEARLSVTLLSEYRSRGVEICRVTDGQVEWTARRQGSNQS